MKGESNEKKIRSSIVIKFVDVRTHICFLVRFQYKYNEERKER